jgi:hypothetical protein
MSRFIGPAGCLDAADDLTDDVPDFGAGVFDFFFKACALDISLIHPIRGANPSSGRSHVGPFVESDTIPDPPMRVKTTGVSRSPGPS